jgi:hypothetical protein
MSSWLSGRLKTRQANPTVGKGEYERRKQRQFLTGFMFFCCASWHSLPFASRY